MKVNRISTGSAETEAFLYKFVDRVDDLSEGVAVGEFSADEYMVKVMTVGRCGQGDAREGSKAKDDTGGFIVERYGFYYLTDKAKDCIRM